MPQTHPHRPGPTTQPPPVGLLLVPAHRRTAPLSDPDAWHGIDSHRLTRLIEHYTRAGDVVLDTDNNPGVAAAARYLDCHPAIVVTDGGHTSVRVADQHSGSGGTTDAREHGVSLLLTGLARTAGNLHEIAESMRRWHRLLRPRGFLLAALAPTGPAPLRVSRRSTVITAARAAGLRYHQHLPVLLVPLPAAEPRTDAATAATTAPALLDGRHAPIHLDVLAFAASTIDQEAVNG